MFKYCSENADPSYLLPSSSNLLAKDNISIISPKRVWSNTPIENEDIITIYPTLLNRKKVKIGINTRKIADV